MIAENECNNECPVCYETTGLQKLNPCEHMLCITCFNKCFKHLLIPLKCPLCRVSLIFPQQDKIVKCVTNYKRTSVLHGTEPNRQLLTKREAIDLILNEFGELFEICDYTKLCYFNVFDFTLKIHQNSYDEHVFDETCYFCDRLNVFIDSIQLGILECRFNLGAHVCKLKLPSCHLKYVISVMVKCVGPNYKLDDSTYDKIRKN